MSKLATVTMGLLLAAPACVFPNQRVTGIEFSWGFIEGNATDGEQGKRLRRCAGIDGGNVEVDVDDINHEDRAGTFNFACDDGFQTPSQAQIEPSNAFVSLREGRYDVAIAALSSSGRFVASDRSVIDVGDRGVALAGWLFTPEPMQWNFDLGGLSTCQQLTLSLVYEDTEAALVEPPEDSDPVIYRAALTSTDGLHLGGMAMDCASLTSQMHVFTDVDRGRYILRADVDGVECSIPLDLDHDQQVTVFRADNLPCQG